MPQEWSDAELIRICLEGSAEELTDEVVAAISERSGHSPLVWEAVRESPHVEAITSRLHIDAHGHQPPPQKAQSGSRILLAVAFGVIALLGVWVGSILSIDQRPSADERIADATDVQALEDGQVNADLSGSKNVVDDPPDTSADPAKENSDAPPEQPESSEQPQVASPDQSVDVEESTAVAENSVNSATEKTETKAVVEPVAEEQAEKSPWTDDLDLAVPPRSFDDVAWHLPGDEKPDEFPPTEFRKWFSTLPGRPFQLLEEKQTNRRFSRFDGTGRLNAPWPDSALLRFSIYDVERCEIYFWDGNSGLRLKFFRTRTPNVWAAHRVTRSTPTSPPQEGEFLTNDCGRWHRSSFGTFDIRWEKGHLRLIRGDVPLLTVPHERRPGAIVLDGKLKFRQLSMLRSDPLPQKVVDRLKSPAGRALLGSTQPAALTWQTNKSELPREGEPAPTGNTGTQQVFAVKDSSVELRVTSEANKHSFAWTPAPNAGLSEFIFRIDSADPGTGVYVGREDGTPVFQIGRVWDPKAGLQGLTFLSPNQVIQNREFNRDTFPPPWSGRGQWLRVVAGCGSVSIWTSPDGKNWGWVNDAPSRGRWPGRRATVGIFANPQADRHIRLSHVEVNELPSLVTLADPELVDRVKPEWFAPLDILDVGSWLHRVIRNRPVEADFEKWRRACAVATLRASPDNELSAFLLNGLLVDALAEDGSRDPGWASAEDLIREVGLLCDLWLSPRPQQIAQLYHELARRRVSAAMLLEDEAPTGAVSHDISSTVLASEFWSSVLPPLTPQYAVRIELTSLVARGQFSEVRNLIDRICFWNANAHPARPWWSAVDPIYSTIVWAELESHISLNSEERTKRISAPGRWKTTLSPARHPLSQSVSKEAYNVMAEFQAAISGQAFGDACQVISSAGSADLFGLLPDSQDGRLLVSFPNAVALAMQQYPSLRQSMNEKFGAIGRLRVRQSIENGDHRQVEAATIQFYGTLAAADSEGWLGNRAMAAGRFAQAFGHFGRALAGFRQNSAVDTPEMSSLVARLRLALAMLGTTASTDEGDKLKRNFDIGARSVTPAELEQLVTEMTPLAAAPGDSGASSTYSADGLQEHDLLPAQAGYKLELRGKLEGDLGDRAGTAGPADVDWVSRQLAIVPEGNLAYFSNRFQVNCIDLTNGQQKWAQALGGDHGNAHHWPMLPMRPVVTSDAIFSRRLTKTGPELLCLNKADGAIRWRVKPQQTLVSDPFLVHGRVHIFATRQAYAGPTILELATVHPQTGTLLNSYEVLKLFDAWQNMTQTCQVTADGGLIYLTADGVSAACNAQGQALWVRRRNRMPQILDSRYRHTRAFIPPVIDGSRVIIAQPECPTIECLDADSGRPVWEKTTPDLKRIVGRFEGSLIIETRDGLESLKLESGSTNWKYQAADLLDAVAIMQPVQPKEGQKEIPTPTILITRAIPYVEGRKNMKLPTLVWLDPNSGAEQVRLPLKTHVDLEPYIGSFITTADRTWCLFARGRKTPQREILELVKDETLKPVPSIDQKAWASWHPEYRLATFADNRVTSPAMLPIVKSAELRRALDDLCPRWIVDAPSQPKESGLRADHLGEKNVLAMKTAARFAPPTGKPAELSDSETVGSIRLIRDIVVPSRHDAGLRFKIGHDKGQKWMLTVDAGGRQLLSTMVDDQTAPNGWQQVDVRLGPLAGQRVRLVLTCSQGEVSKQTFAYLSGFSDLEQQLSALTP